MQSLIIAEKLGYANVEFHKGLIQHAADIVAAESVDIVISNCVLNLVAEQDRREMISVVYRVLRSGGRVAISDIVCEERVPEVMRLVYLLVIYFVCIQNLLTPKNGIKNYWILARVFQAGLKRLFLVFQDQMFMVF